MGIIGSRIIGTYRTPLLISMFALASALFVAGCDWANVGGPW